jgi:hypothetical protein
MAECRLFETASCSSEFKFVAYDVTGRDLRIGVRLLGSRKEEESEGTMVPGFSDMVWKLRLHRSKVN